MKTYKIAAIPADAIGPEVIGAGLQVLKALEQKREQYQFDVRSFD